MSEFTLSCLTCALRAPHKDELAETFKYAPAAGYRYWGTAGPALWTPFIGPWLDAEKIKAEAAKAGLIGCTEVYSPQIVTKSVEEAIASVEAIVAQAEYTVRMDCPLMVITGGRRVEGTGGLEASVAGLKTLLSRIEGMPIRVALESHVFSQFEDDGDYDYIFGEIDHLQLGITIDTGHLHWAKVDTVALIHRWAPKIWNVHLKDVAERASVAIGEGNVDLKAIVTALHEIDFKGALGLEIEPVDTENLPKYVADSYPLLSDMVEKITGARPE